MKIVALSIAAVVALSIGAAFLLDLTQEPAYRAYSTESTRVGDPGHNLVETWEGPTGRIWRGGRTAEH